MVDLALVPTPDQITVACCQIAPAVEQPDTNLELTRSAVREAVEAGARLVVLPELALSGYVFASVEEARAAAVRADGPELAAWAEEAARGDAVVIGGFCELGSDGRLFNSCALVDSGGTRAVYRKIHLWADEPRWFHGGEEPAQVVETAIGRVGLAVCYDLEFPEVMRGLALAGAELIALPANWPRDEVARETPILTSLASVTAYLNKTFVAVCDRCGVERGLEFEGGTVIAGPDGRVLAGGGGGPGGPGERGIVAASCDLASACSKANGALNDAFADRRPELYRQDLADRNRT